MWLSWLHKRQWITSVLFVRLRRLRSPTTAFYDLENNESRSFQKIKFYATLSRRCPSDVKGYLMQRSQTLVFGSQLSAYFYSTSISSASVSVSSVTRKSLCKAALAEALLLGSSSNNISRNLIASLTSGSNAFPSSGRWLYADHWTTCHRGKPLSPTVPSVQSNIEPWSIAVLFILFLPNIVANSIMASTSSAEWKNGKRSARIVKRITPADQMSIFVV